MGGGASVPWGDRGGRRDPPKLVARAPRGKRRPPLVMPARQVLRPDVTAASAQERYRYDWAGFRCDIPAALLRIAGRWLTGTWDCVVLVRSRGVWRPARLSSAGPPPDDPGPRRGAPRPTAGLQWTGGRLQIRFRRDDEGPAAAPGSVAAPRSVALEQGWDNE